MTKEIVEPKFTVDNQIYFDYMNWLLDSPNYSKEDLIFHFPAFVGQVNLARFLTFVDAFRRVQKLSGDLGDFGTYKGGSFFAMGKLVSIFEPFSNTKVHGFDWFKGQAQGAGDRREHEGNYKVDKEAITALLVRQGLEGVMELHDIDLTAEFDNFLTLNPALRFKLAFIDCGSKKVLESTVSAVWNRMVPGGCLMLDHFNHHASPSESEIVMTVVGDALIEQFDYSRSPTAIIQKPHQP